jgi:hypothetical protein
MYAAASREVLILCARRGNQIPAQQDTEGAAGKCRLSFTATKDGEKTGSEGDAVVFGIAAVVHAAVDSVLPIVIV